LNGQSLTIGLGTPDNLVLRGNAFHVIVAQDGAGTMVGAARVSEAGGKVVAFNKVGHRGTVLEAVTRFFPARARLGGQSAQH
jgi:hypothetical protein